MKFTENIDIARGSGYLCLIRLPTLVRHFFSLWWNDRPAVVHYIGFQGALFMHYVVNLFQGSSGTSVSAVCG